SSPWNCSTVFPVPGSTITVGPLGTETQAPMARLTTTVAASVFFIASILSRRHLDPGLWARLHARIVALRARTLIPVRLGRLRSRRRSRGRRLAGHRGLLLHVRGRLLHDDRRRRIDVVRRRRIVPVRIGTVPERRPDADEDARAAMEMASPGEAGGCREEKHRQAQQGGGCELTHEGTLQATSTMSPFGVFSTGTRTA